MLRALAHSEAVPYHKDAFVFIPPHIRVIEVTQDPIVLGPMESLADNLLYGLKEGTYDRKREIARACRIATRLGLTNRLIEHVETDNMLGVNGCKISRTDRTLIHLARAFVTNPEVLVLHKPAVLVDNVLRARIFTMMRDFVRQRGIDQDANEPIERRRVRTIVYSCSRNSETVMADRVFNINMGCLCEIQNRKRVGLKC